MSSVGFQTPITAVLLVSVVMGMLVPYTIYQSTRNDALTIPLPGEPISETVYASLAANDSDSVIFTGEWQEALGFSHTYLLTLDEPAISDTAGLDLANAFIDSNLKSLVSDGVLDNPQGGMEGRLWHYTFTNDSYTGPMMLHGLYVRVSVNSVSGKVAMYYEVWSSEFSSHHSWILTPMNPDGRVIDPSQARVISRDFLYSHNYTLPRSTRLIDTRLEYRQVDTEPGPPENYSRPVYHIELAIPTGEVFPVKWLQGVLIEIDAITGRVFYFGYMALDIPKAGTEGLVDVSLARNVAISYVASYSERRVCLRLEPWPYAIPTSQSWEFRLTWTFEYNVTGPWGVSVSEYSVDARTGESFRPSPLLSGGGIIPRNSIGNVAVVCFLSLFCASIGFLWTRRYVSSDSTPESHEESHEPPKEIESKAIGT
ncbi:MAG: hypothetical protein C4K49_09730 [Candidatus Thorarchaeota archaeon]|nr:MAG: hypothetical protein C4K49_09730 [Candidatus Thorarchaeota archaeon]